MKYGIFGTRGAGDRVYFCSDATQGERFVSTASSYAATYTKAGAKKKKKELEKKYLGLTLFVFQQIDY